MISTIKFRYNPKTRILFMNTFLKSTYLALIAVLSLACDGSSSNSGKIESYSLDEYRGRNVSSDSLAGTWVSVSLGEANSISDFGDIYEQSSTKEYFVIRAVGDSSYQKASCTSRFYDIEKEGTNESSFEGIKGTFTNNNSFSGERTVEFQIEDSPDGNYSESSYERFQMIKISDRVQSLGTVFTTIVGGRFVWDDSYCFIQISRRMNFKNSEIDGVHSEVGYVVGVDGEYQLSMSKWEQDTADSVVNMFVQGQDFSSIDSSDTDYTVNYESKFSNNITFSASGRGREISGDVEIQLPIY